MISFRISNGRIPYLNLSLIKISRIHTFIHPLKLLFSAVSIIACSAIEVQCESNEVTGTQSKLFLFVSFQ